jgi:hypothetical protein
VLWSALFEGKVVGEVIADKPNLNFVRGPNDKQSQLSIDAEWLEVVKDLFPLRINRFEINEGQAHFRDFHTEPKVNVELERLNLVGTNFSNTREPTTESLAKIDAEAIAEGKAKLKFNGTVQPAERSPTFQFKSSLVSLPATRLNDLLRAYLNLDAESGTIDVYLEVDVKKGRIEGQMKPLIKELKLLKVPEEGFFETIWEGIVGFVAEILENQSHDQIGSVVPFSGSLDNPKFNRWTAFLEILRNAFVEALGPGFKKSVLEQQGKPKPESESKK